ncbi:MAG: OB-fold nucleic acid binding domain-containing protein [Rhodospirillaceae bacterium]
MKRNSLLTAGAALAIAGAAVVGGYFIDRMPSQSVEVATTTEPHSVMVPPPTAAKHAAKPTSVATVTAPSVLPSKPATAPLLSDTVADKALVALSGTVTDKKGNTLTLNEASGPVRVVMREDVPRPRDTVRVTRTVDKIDVGAPVTVYGRLRTTDPDMPKLYADAVYDPATKTLYQLNSDRSAQELTSAQITSRYTPVGKTKTAKVSMDKVSKITTER